MIKKNNEIVYNIKYIGFGNPGMRVICAGYKNERCLKEIREDICWKFKRRSVKKYVFK